MNERPEVAHLGSCFSVSRHYDTIRMTVAIVGAGIIGTSIAYYLSQIRKDTAPEDIHIIEASPELFASASGHAAGFIARDWFSDSVASLGALSFDLHQQLAKDENGHEIWGYCPTTSMSLGETLDFEDLGTPANDAIGSRRKDAKTQKPAGKHGPNWLTNHHTKFELLGNIKHCAQLWVIPFCFQNAKESFGCPGFC